MAVLQAARAYELGLSIREAKSWGLNRAIFYAAAKRGFKEKKIRVLKRTPEQIKMHPIRKAKKAYFLGDEMAYASRKQGRTYFTIGGKFQTENDFKRQIEARFRDGFKKAWNEAVQIVQEYPKGTLLSQRDFFDEVYKPRRDELTSKWAHEMGERE
jgi:hypothetical protein